MTIDLKPLSNTSKLLFDVELAPLQGNTFQPTGFPDLGAATYESKEGTCLLVESAQSMANRMEAVCWDEGKQDLVEDLRGLSYVKVNDKKATFLTSSVLEAHRLNSVYIEKSKRSGADFSKVLAEEISWVESRPVNRRAFVDTVMKYDIGSLVHGVFLESIGGRLRLSRALTAFIEADDVRVAASGGVKNDNVRPSKDETSAGTAKEGFGNVPFHRDEFAAKGKIHLYANLDLAQIRGYGLDEAATRLLVLLSLYKLRALLDGNLRLRTRCDFRLVNEEVGATKLDFMLPDLGSLAVAVRASIGSCMKHFAEGGVTVVEFAG
ncbi:MAG: type I-U CRISPR-associated protein Cas7 [Labilithrix sp.]|nr:type I-U CRISPR-associated protein Cas7 [Labilithrix sp.]